MDFDAVVVGGGVAGLTSAAHLAERGLRVLLLESNSRWVGGRLAGGEDETFTHAGRSWSFPSEHGIHGLWGGYMNMWTTIRRFIPDDSLHPVPSTGETWINRWGERVWSVEAGTAVRSRLLPAPFHYLNLLLRPRFWGSITPLDFLSAGGLTFSTLWTVGYDPIAEESTLPGFTMDDYFRLWTPNLRTTIEGVARNMLAAPDEHITLTGLIAALRFYTMLRRADWHPHFFPANSRTAYIQPMTHAVESRGGVVLRGQTVTHLSQPDDHQWRIHFRDTAGAQRFVDAPDVVLAAHAAAAQGILTASDPTRAAATDMSFPPTLRNATVRLWFAADPKDPAPSGMFTGDFTPDNYFWLHRIHREYDAWAADGNSAIELHYYGDHHAMNAPDRTFQIDALNEIHRAFPELRGHLVHAAVRRNSKTHTAFRVPTEHTLGVNTPWDGLHAAGDYVRYPTPSLWMERATTTGLAAANAVLARHNRDPFPVLQPPPPELPVRVLGGGVRGVRAIFSPLISIARNRHTTSNP